MQRGGIAGRNGTRKWRGLPGLATAEDLVDRVFRRERPNQLWLTDIGGAARKSFSSRRTSEAERVSFLALARANAQP